MTRYILTSLAVVLTYVISVVSMPTTPCVDTFCKMDPCVYSVCNLHPEAECRANYCGGCNAEFWLNGHQLLPEECAHVTIG